jgi:hypothetical protein
MQEGSAKFAYRSDIANKNFEIATLIPGQIPAIPSATLSSALNRLGAQRCDNAPQSPVDNPKGKFASSWNFEPARS